MSVKAQMNYESVPMSVWLKTFIGFIIISMTILFSPVIISTYFPSMNNDEKLLVNIIFCMVMLYCLVPILKLVIPLVTAKLFGKTDISIDDSMITIVRNSKIKRISWNEISKIKRETISEENYIIVVIGWPFELIIEDSKVWETFNWVCKLVPTNKISHKINREK